jgi:extracellular factor (EF) 3-hydroxypalmitic acid methyl ester biosynthesis protein
MNTLQLQGQQLFDNVYAQIADHQISSGMKQLFSGLRQLRRGARAEEWREFSLDAWQSHPLKAVAHEEPITRRAFEKPRGYAGDAELIDLIYGLREMPRMSSVGAALYAYLFQAPATSAVRARRDHLAARLDEVATKVKNPRVLSVACGHLREAQRSAAAADRAFGEFIALDQDPASIALVEREQSAFGVKPVNDSVRSILKGKLVFEGLDFVYSTGLYDYLPQPVATDLTTRLFEMLKPGGELLVANFLPDVPDVGYMETFMGWPLIYRSREELADVATRIPAEQIAAIRTYCDSYQNVVYLEIEKQ